MKPNWDYWGYDLYSSTGQTTYAECCGKCSNDSRCNTFTWNRLTKGCNLKSSIGNDGQSHPHTIAGRRRGKTDRYEISQFFQKICVKKRFK